MEAISLSTVVCIALLAMFGVGCWLWYGVPDEYEYDRPLEYTADNVSVGRIYEIGKGSQTQMIVVLNILDDMFYFRVLPELELSNASKPRLSPDLCGWVKCLRSDRPVTKDDLLPAPGGNTSWDSVAT